MKLVRVAAAVLNQTPLDWENNKRHILQALASARADQASVVCLPELCITGYGCEDAFHSPGTARMAIRVLDEILPETKGLIASFGMPVWHGGGLFNCACLVADGQLLGFVAKQNLAGDGIHYEPRWFKPWPDDIVSEIEISGRRVPIGDLVFDCGGLRLGFEICEDAWVGARPGADLAARNVNVILNPSASHFAFDKQKVRQRFVIEGSRAFHVCYVYANLLGNEAGRAIYDGDAMIASAGKMRAIGPRFSYRDAHVTTAVIDIDEARLSRVRTGSYQPLIETQQANNVAVNFTFPDLLPDATTAAAIPWEESEHRKEEEFTRAVALGLFDYMRKSKSHGFVVSLSGGADSAACAVLSSICFRLARNDLDEEGLRNKLFYMDDLDAADANQLTQRLLTCAYQPTRNSGEVTRQAAASVAEAINARHLILDVDSIVQQYIQVVSEAIHRPLSWETDDVALQNIQARARAPSVWLIANLQNALLLATSNRSEAAVGYTTMDGDTCGGISPIAGIDKAFLRKWLIWMEEHGPADLGPLPALSLVNVQQPTAELRPPAEGQTDESDLMPYAVLDEIERAAIRDKLTPLEVYQRLSASQTHAPLQLLDWVRRFFRLWSRNQWKRERFAPSFHLDDENLDPKTWCRFPILSGGFERELAELQQWVADKYPTA